MGTTEQAIRDRLGVPADARKVLLFGETSHWDPNWLLTADEYYRLRIQRIMDAVLEELTREPRRIYSVECLFFFTEYWDRNPQRREALRELVNQGRIRLTGSGITTPDTVLPDTEPILRDYLYGQQWLLEHGMTQEPRLAYLPDDFGHTPALPTLLGALGYTMAGVTRIDGMFFAGTDYRLPGSFPQEGSSAELLLKQEKTLDFVWRAPDGAEVLCHWNAFSYFQGDMLASLGIIRWMGITFGVPWRTAGHINRRVAAYTRQLQPYARTPYLFCPIGCDFNGPIPGLLDLLDRYNETRYQDSGVYVVNAAMDDYLELVGCHKQRLPTLSLDPNPYWMGFYASRPEAKRLCKEISRRLVLTERLAAVPQAMPAGGANGVPAARHDPSVIRRARAAWDDVVVSNHHDFITGTSPDRVWRKEQQQMLQLAEARSVAALERIKTGWPQAPSTPPAEPPRWTLADGALDVTTSHYRLRITEEHGGCIVNLRAGDGGPELLSGPANDLVAYRDSGGLWRLGHEFAGGTFSECCKASQGPATVEAVERDGLLEVRVDCSLAGRPFVRWLWLREDSPVIRLRLIGSAAHRRSITCRFPTYLDAGGLTMDVPGGVVQRPLLKIHDPTFWPAATFAHLVQPLSERGLAAFLGGPACVSVSPGGVVDLLALRNAPREVAWGLLPIPAHPVSGHDGETHTFDYAVWFTEKGDYRHNRLPRLARRVLDEQRELPGAPDHAALADQLLSVDRHDVQVAAAKPADRGEGLIVRLHAQAPAGASANLTCSLGGIRVATLCDARERDLDRLEVSAGKASVPLQGAITTVRLVF